jgi:stage V sporulation protein K
VEKRNNPIDILEKALLDLKNYLEKGMSGHTTIDLNFVQNLHTETKIVVSICNELNKDNEFIVRLNQQIQNNSKTGLLKKTEHFVLSDLIKLYVSGPEQENDKSRFTLAYYYDALCNNQFADGSQLDELNQLVESSAFLNQLNKIKSERIIVQKSSVQSYFLPPLLSSLKHPKLSVIKKHYQRFVQFSGKEQLIEAIDEQFEFQVENDVLEEEVDSTDTLEIVLDELNNLIGLSEVKQNINDLINLLNIQKRRSEEGLKNVEFTLHAVFLGPPGTGKTSVARLLSRIYKQLGYLTKGQLVETDREGMVAGYVGQTATKVDTLVQEGLGGVLFIDEAYALTQVAFETDYGTEAVNTLLKRMEDHRTDFAVVVAGYTEPMKAFVESNPGLRSRFNRYFLFDHFRPEELFQIFNRYCASSDFIVDTEAEEKLKDTFELLYEKRDAHFGNARVVRNLFEKCLQNQANRIVKLKEITPDILQKIAEEDIPEPKDTLKHVLFFQDDTQD